MWWKLTAFSSIVKLFVRLVITSKGCLSVPFPCVSGIKHSPKPPIAAHGFKLNDGVLTKKCLWNYIPFAMGIQGWQWNSTYKGKVTKGFGVSFSLAWVICESIIYLLATCDTMSPNDITSIAKPYGATQATEKKIRYRAAHPWERDLGALRSFEFNLDSVVSPIPLLCGLKYREKLHDYASPMYTTEAKMSHESHGVSNQICSGYQRRKQQSTMTQWFLRTNGQ